jgi:hypothetical protein
MTNLERVARAALAGDAIGTRSLVQEWLQTRPNVTVEPAPAAALDPTVASLTAALGELLAGRLNQLPPHWTAAIGPAPSPVYLPQAATRMRRLRESCRAEAPRPLRRRHFYAPANYLELV